MMPHIYVSLWGYPGRWVHSLEDGPNLTVTKLLEHMDHAFGDVCEYDNMICSLYEIRQKEGESMEEYMLQINKAIVVICHTYPDWVTDQGKNLAWNRFYHGLTPHLWDALGFMMAKLLEREQDVTSFDMLYTLAKKMEVQQPSHPPRSGLGSSVLIGISTGDILFLWDRLQCWQRRNCSHLTLNCQTLRCPSQMSLRG